MFQNFFVHWDMGEWLEAIAVVAATFAAHLLLRTTLKRVKRRDGTNWIHALAPSLSNLIFIVGLRAFSEVAPLKEKVSNWLDHGAYVLAVILVLGIIRRAALLSIEWSADRAQNSKTLQLGFVPLMRNVITLFVFFSGAIMLLKHFNYDVMSLLTALGVGSLAVGLASKETLSNMISGFTLIIDRNLLPGDQINLAGSIGKVEEIGLRSTRFQTGEGNTLIVPNSELVNTKILNLSMPSRDTACSTTFKIQAKIPFSQIREICIDAIADVGAANKQRSSYVHLTSINDGVQTIQAGFWISSMEDTGKALSQFHEGVLQKMKDAGITLASTPA